MTNARELLANLRSRGVELETDGERLRWRPRFLVTATHLELLNQHRSEIIALLTADFPLGRCPACFWTLDAEMRCPKCFDRLCVDCGKLTGSYLIQRCVACGHAQP